MTLLPARAPPPAAYLARAPLRHPRAARRAVACAAQPHVDVAIVGGGPAGLAAAHAVLRHAPDLSVRVFEGGREYRAQGAGVLLNINGWRALEALKPSLRERLWQDSIRLQGSRQFTEAGERLESPFGGGGGWGHEANLERYGCTLQLAAWSAIRDVLYEELPEGVVQFGSKVEVRPKNNTRGALAARAAPAHHHHHHHSPSHLSLLVICHRMNPVINNAQPKQ